MKKTDDTDIKRIEKLEKKFKKLQRMVLDIRGELVMAGVIDRGIPSAQAQELCGRSPIPYPEKVT